MRRFFLALIVLSSVVYLGGAVTDYVAKQTSPARWLGWESDLRAAAPDGGPNAIPTPDDLLGFSRYLPAETESYASILQLGRLGREIGASNAWQRIASQPEVQQLLAQARTAMGEAKIPPEAMTAIELLQATFDSEISMATGPETSRDVLAMIRTGVLSLALFAPGPDADSGEAGKMLEEKRAPLRQQWSEVLPMVRVPSFVIAGRVRDEAKFNAFVKTMLDQGWQAALAELNQDKKIPPPVRDALQKAYGDQTIGKVRLQRFQMKLGDVVSRAQLEAGLRRSPLSDEMRKAVVDAASALSVQVHLGFVGEYLTLVVSSDDRFVSQIVERFEGRSKSTLAAAPAFAKIRSELTPNTLAVSYADATAGQKEIHKTLLPLIDQVTNVEFLDLLNVPLPMVSSIVRMRANLEQLVSVSPLRTEAVITIDRGIRQFQRKELDIAPLTEPAKALRVPSLVPADAIGYGAMREGSFEGLWEYFRMMNEQFNDQMEMMARQRPELADVLRQQQGKFDAILEPIDDKLSPATEGEIGFVAGKFNTFKIEGLPDQGPKAITSFSLPIPTAAMVLYSPAPDDVISGLEDLLDAVIDMIPPQAKAEGAPVSFTEDTEDGIKAWFLTIAEISELSIEGLEPHMTRIGDAVVFSTSFELTKQIRDTMQRKAATITTTDTYRTMKDLLPEKAESQTFVNGLSLNSNLRLAAKEVFQFITLHRNELRMSKENQLHVEIGRRYVDVMLDVMGCWRGSAASTVREGSAFTLREWDHFEDLKAK